eukprot:9477061-Pyramimonas_sp.AAC.1
MRLAKHSALGGGAPPGLGRRRGRREGTPAGHDACRDAGTHRMNHPARSTSPFRPAAQPSSCGRPALSPSTRGPSACAAS